MATIQNCPTTFSKLVMCCWGHAARQLRNVALHLYETRWQGLVEDFYPAPDLCGSNAKLEPFLPWGTALNYLHVSGLKNHGDPLSRNRPKRTPNLPFATQIVKHSSIAA